MLFLVIVFTFSIASSTISLNARLSFDFAYSACCVVKLRNSAAIYSPSAPNLSFGCELIERNASTAISFNCIFSICFEVTDVVEAFEALDDGRVEALRLRCVVGDETMFESIPKSSKMD